MTFEAHSKPVNGSRNYHLAIPAPGETLTEQIWLGLEHGPAKAVEMTSHSRFEHDLSKGSRFEHDLLRAGVYILPHVSMVRTRPRNEVPYRLPLTEI